jgi:hypothetical protein
MASVRRWVTLLALAAPLAGAAPDGAGAQATRPGPPHEWVFGAWTGGLFPVSEVDPAACFGAPTVIFTRDVVMRVAAFDATYHQRAIETAATLPDGGLEFRFVPAAPMARTMAGRLPPDIGFGCGGSPDLLRVQRRGPDEIVFPDCADFPSPLKRCGAR